MTNSVANNGNPFGAADYAKNRNRILETGIDPKIDCGYIRKERWYEKYYKNRKK